MNWHYSKNGEDVILRLARELVETPELGGFLAVQDADTFNGGGYVRLVKDNLSVYIHEGPWSNKPGKVFFAGEKPDDPNRDVHTFKHYEIGVSLSRGAAVIAREISRRLLPDYTREVQSALEQMAHETGRRERRDRLAKILANRLPYGVANIDERSSVTRIRFDDGRQWNAVGHIKGDFNAYMDGSAKVELSSSNAAFLQELADLIYKYSA